MADAAFRSLSRTAASRPVLAMTAPTSAYIGASAAKVEAMSRATGPPRGATLGPEPGLTKQGAQQRFRAARDQAKAVTTASRSNNKAGPVA